MSIEQIRTFFEPRSVAVVGASRNPFKFGSVIVYNLQNLGFPGNLCIINPNAGVPDIRGIPCYPALKAVPEPPELAVLALPAQAMAAAMQDCAEAGVTNAVIISSGFSEAGPEGQRRLDEVMSIARAAGIRIAGPNTTGILSPAARFTTTFVPLPAGLKNGLVAFISQTGMFAGVMLSHILTAERFGVSRVAGLGNKCDVDDSDILEYLYDDSATRAVMIYMEGAGGRGFLQTARRFTEKKPIVLLKGGRSPDGARAAFSHTGSLASDYAMVSDLFKSAGIVLANDMDDMIDYAKMLAYQSPPAGPRLGVVSMSGGAAVVASDMVDEVGLTLAPVSVEELSPIQAMLPSWATISHPMDIEPLMETVGGNEAYRIGLDAILHNARVDMALLIMGLGIFDEEREAAAVEVLAPVLRGAAKPVAVSLIGPRSHCDRVAGLLEEMKVPAYTGVTRAIRSLAALAEYGRIRER